MLADFSYLFYSALLCYFLLWLNLKFWSFNKLKIAISQQAFLAKWLRRPICNREIMGSIPIEGRIFYYLKKSNLLVGTDGFQPLLFLGLIVLQDKKESALVSLPSANRCRCGGFVCIHFRHYFSTPIMRSRQAEALSTFLASTSFGALSRRIIISFINCITARILSDEIF